RLMRQLGDAQEPALQIVSRAQRRPRAGVVGVLFGRLFKVMECAIKRITAARAQVDHAPREALVSLDRFGLFRFDIGDLGSAKLEVEPLAQLVNYLVLKTENLFDISVDLYRSDHLPGIDVDHPCGDSYHLAHPLVAAAQYPRRREPPADVDGNRLVQVL